MQHRVRDLSPDARVVMEQLVGHSLVDTDLLVIRSIPLVKDGPTPEERVEIAKQFAAHFDRVNERIEGIDEREFEEAADEAIREVRKSRKAVK